MTERQQMLQRVSIYNFALVDTALFLDSHPRCKAALDFYQQNQLLFQQAVADYEAKYGPLTHASGSDGSRWNWIDDPWPWEGADN